MKNQLILFPCKHDKSPDVKSSWKNFDQSHYDTALARLSSGKGLVGVVVPSGHFLIDIDSYKDECSSLEQIEEKLGAPLPAPNEELPEDVEIQLARVVAEAGKQLTQANQQQAAQQAAQQQAQDPVFQLQQQEMQIKGAEVQRKAQKDAADIQLRQEDMKRKLTKDMADAKLDEERIKLEKLEIGIDAKKAGAKLQVEKQKNRDKVVTELKRDT
jgi:hypothetical protein